MSALLRKCPDKIRLAKESLPVFTQFMKGTTTRQASNMEVKIKHKVFAKLPKLLTNFETTTRQKSTLLDKPRDFYAVFPDIMRDLSETVNKYKQGQTTAWLSRVLEYNLRNAEKNILLLTVLTYEHLVKRENFNSDNLRLSYILGWCAEMLNTSILMYDDIMDNGAARRGLPCWHTLENVGLSGLNDAFIMENAVYIILKKNFRHLDCYLDIMELFHEVAFITGCGQCLDMACASKTCNEFNMETYKVMAVNKATYDNFYSPFAAGMYLAGFKDKRAFAESKSIIHDIGLFFQIQNDYLDCFGTPKEAGKIGTDIQDNKYSWLAITCMERANETQKQLMIDCYGKNDPTTVQKVKELYRDLDLPGVYAAYEEDSYNKTKSRIEQTSNGVPHEIFLEILNKIYRRKI